MTLALQQLETTGELSYIAKHNGNYQAIENAFNAMESLMFGTVGANITAPEAFAAMFGTINAFIGSASFAYSTAGTSMTLQPGWAWLYGSRTVASSSGESVLSFLGLPADTYYIHIAADGSITKDTINADTFYSVVWTGSSFGAITKTANTIWGSADMIATQTSTALGATYTTLDQRFEAGEAKALLGADANTALNGMLTKDVSSGANVTLTALESQNSFFVFTGAITADTTVTFNSTKMPRLFSVKNETTGPYRLTIKLTTGIDIPQGYKVVCARNGTAIEQADSDDDVVAAVIPYAANVTLDWSKYNVAHITLTGNITITNTNAPKGRKCLLFLAQDAVGGRTVTFGAEVVYGTDIGGFSPTSDPDKTDEVALSHNWVSGKYHVVSIARGYAN